MGAAAEVSDMDTVGKQALCAVLGWARTTLDHRLKVDPNFPVVSVGDQRGGWQFDVDAVRAYLASEPASAPGSGATAPGKPAAVPDTVAAGIPPRLSTASTAAEATARQRKDSAQAALLEDKARLTRGELVERAKMENDVGLMIARFAKGLDGLPDTIAKRLGLPEESTAVMRELVDEMRRSMVDDIRECLADPLG